MTEFKESNKYRVFVDSSLVIIGLLLFLPAICTSKSDASIEWSLQVLVFALIAFICQFVSFKRLVSCPRVLFLAFILLSYLFNISQVVLFGIGFELSSSLAWNSVFNTTYVVEATFLALKSILYLFWGGIAYYTFFYKNRITLQPPPSPPRKIFLYVVLVIGIVFDVLNSIVVPIVYGYYDVETTTTRLFLRYVSCFFSSAIVLFLTHPGFSKRERKIFLILFVFYKAVCMLTGYRAFALINIVLAFFIYHRTVNKIKLSFKTALLGVFVMIIGTTYMVVIRETRLDGVDLAGMTDTSLVGNPILDILSEFGTTLNVVCQTLQETNGRGIGGGQLFTSLLSILPGVSNLFPNLDFSAMTMDTAMELRHMGGSYVGDLLFDFGEGGIALGSFILGAFVAFFFESFERALEQKRFVYAAYLFPIAIDIIFCVRSSLAKMPREIVWYFFMYFFIWVLFAGARKGQRFSYS